MIGSGLFQDDASLFIKLVGFLRALGKLEISVRIVQAVIDISERTGQDWGGI